MNSFFPVEYSTLSSRHLLQLIISRYNISTSASISFIKRGFNDTYLITDNNNNYIFRVYKHLWKSLANVETEVKLLNYLHEHHVTVSRPICDCNSNYIQTVSAPEGLRCAVLFTFAQGLSVKKLSLEQSFVLGKQTGKMHQLTQNNNFGETAFTYNFENLFNNTLTTLKPILSAYTEQYNYLLALKKEFLEVWENAPKNEIAQGICHGDLQAENFHLTSNNELTFFDFDFSGNGSLIYDIGVFIWYDHKNKPKEIITSFLKGYVTQRELTETELNLLPYFSTLRALFQMNLFCTISNGSALPLWPAEQVAGFISKIKKWQEIKRQSFL